VRYGNPRQRLDMDVEDTDIEDPSEHTKYVHESIETYR